MIKSLRCCVCVIALGLVMGYFSAAGAVADAKQRILILHSYHKGLQWTDTVDEGILSIINTRPSAYDMHTEYMDMKRHSGEQHLRALLDTYRMKYRSLKFDVILVSDEDGFNFLLRHHDSLFPGVPVVFCGVNYFDEVSIENKRDIYTGVVEAYDIRNTLRTALKLHPNTYRIVAVNDRTATGQANKRILQEVMPEFDKKVSVVYFEDYTMPELRKAVRALTTGDLILLMTFNKDRDGRVFDYDESVALISGESRVPIYGVWDFYLGRGIVGGMLTSGRDQGRVAAAMALRILDGEKVRDIPVIKESPNRYMFDYVQIKKFAISMSAMPPGSIIVNKPVTFYEEHKGKVWAVTAIIAALTTMLIFLLINIERRKKTEAELRVSEDRFERIFLHSPDWIAIMRLSDSRYINVNDAFEKITGFTREEVIGKTPLDIGIYANPDERYEIDDDFLRLGRREKQEIQYRMKSGEIRTFQRSGELAVINNERCIISIVRDITKEKEAEQALLENVLQKKLRAEAEIKMLQAQINPHFLFNAITTIINYTRTDPPVATDLLYKLAEFFRKNIKPGSERVPLSKELEHCEDYIVIERARFEERVKVTYDIGLDTRDCLVPPLILQPLVENALKHGILPKPVGGEIIISSRKEDGLVRISVKDTGVGMDQKKVDTLFSEELWNDTPKKKGAGIAIRNVNARLVSIYGPEHALRIESKPGKGTTMWFTIPVAC